MAGIESRREQSPSNNRSADCRGAQSPTPRARQIVKLWCQIGLEAAPEGAEWFVHGFHLWLAHQSMPDVAASTEPNVQPHICSLRAHCSPVMRAVCRSISSRSCANRLTNLQRLGAWLSSMGPIEALDVAASAASTLLPGLTWR